MRKCADIEILSVGKDCSKTDSLWNTALIIFFYSPPPIVILGSSGFSVVWGFFSSVHPVSCSALDKCGAESESISPKRRDHITFSPNVYVNLLSAYSLLIVYPLLFLLDKAWRHHCHPCLWTLGYRTKAKTATAGMVWPSCLPKKRNVQSYAARLYPFSKQR